jgi:hypothetical protein
MLFQTEEVPERSFNEWYIRTFTASQSQKEIKQLPMLEKIYSIYSAILNIGEQVNTMHAKGKGANAVNQVIQTATLETLPA